MAVQHAFLFLIFLVLILYLVSRKQLLLFQCTFEFLCHILRRLLQRYPDK